MTAARGCKNLLLARNRNMSLLCVSPRKSIVPNFKVHIKATNKILSLKI